MNSSSLKKTNDCKGDYVQGYLQRTNSECLHMEESEERVEDKGKKWILRCKKVQITVSITSEEQKPHPHIDNLLHSKNIWFVGLYFILETEQLFLYSMLPNKVDHETVNHYIQNIQGMSSLAL